MAMKIYFNSTVANQDGYIRFTVNPQRRIKQHNGEKSCGAWRTKRGRPWEMVLCIYGFPSNVSALQVISTSLTVLHYTKILKVYKVYEFFSLIYYCMYEHAITCKSMITYMKSSLGSY